MGPTALVPSQSVFGTLPRLPIVDSSSPNQTERMHAMQVARIEVANVVAENKIKRALKLQVPRNADSVFRKGQFLEYSERPIECTSDRYPS